MISDAITEVLFRMRMDLRETREADPGLYDAMNHHLATLGVLAAQLARVEQAVAEKAEAEARAVSMLPGAIAAGVVVPFRRRVVTA